jgi:quercetin dioxygenase-like cupin family protein
MNSHVSGASKTGSPAQVSGYLERARTENSYWYGTALVSMLATSAQTGGSFALLEGMTHPGEEVPFHTHSREDESLYLLSGEMTFHIGEITLQARAGDFVFLPRNVQHSWRSNSEARFLVLIIPGGFEASFIEYSQPAPVVALPPPPEQPPDETDFQALIERENELGVFYDFQLESGG